MICNKLNSIGDQFYCYKNSIGTVKRHISNILIHSGPFQVMPSAYEITCPIDFLHHTEDSLKQLFRLRENVFLSLGSICNLDKVKKSLELSDKTLIIYENLIYISGLKKNYYNNEWEDFFSSIETLCEAMRLKKSLRRLFPNLSSSIRQNKPHIYYASKSSYHRNFPPLIAPNLSQCNLHPSKIFTVEIP